MEEPECRFLTNTFDPCHESAKMYLCYSYHAWMAGQRAMESEWQHHLNYIATHTVGRPKTTDTYTQKQLEDMDMVGIYMNPT